MGAPPQAAPHPPWLRLNGVGLRPSGALPAPVAPPRAAPDQPSPAGELSVAVEEGERLRRFYADPVVRQRIGEFLGACQARQATAVFVSEPLPTSERPFCPRPVAAVIDITAPGAGERQAALAEILGAAEAAAILGVRRFVIHPGPEKSGLPHEERLARMENAAAVLDQVAVRCQELGIALLFENMLPHLFSGAVSDLLWLLGTMRSTAVGVCLDVGHAFLTGDLHGVVHKLSGHLRMLHASDNRRQFDDHLPPGEGAVPWPALWRQLHASGFHGTVMLEIAGHGSPETILAGAQRARAFLEQLTECVDGAVGGA